MNYSVKKSEEKPETTEILAEAIIRISDALTKLKSSGLNEEAILVLVQARTKLSARDIRMVFDALRRLKGWYCK